MLSSHEETWRTFKFILLSEQNQSVSLFYELGYSLSWATFHVQLQGI